MSQFHVNQIATYLKNQYEAEYWKSELDEANNLSRLLALHAAEFVMREGSNEERTIEIIDGDGDRGIDAVGVDPIANIVVLVQSKWRQDGSGSLKLDGMLQFLDGVRSLIGMGRASSPANASPEVRDLLQKVLRTPGAKIRMVTVSTASEPLSEAVEQPMLELLEKLNDLQDVEPLGTHTHLGQADLFKSIAGGTDAEVDIETQVLDWGRLVEPRRAYYGRVSAAEIARWYVDYGVELFAENIRVVIPRSEINDGIKATIVNSPEEFFYFNNGITVLAESIEMGAGGALSRDVGYFKLKNASIVNGAQTVSTLGMLVDLEHGENLGRAFVMVRFIEVPAEEEDLAALITRFANTQNQVSSQDFAFLDPEQSRLVRELRVLGFEYLLRSGENPKTKSSDPAKVIKVREAAVALACASSELSHCVTAKREVSRLFTDTYSTIFNKTTDPLRLSRAVRVVSEVNGALDCLQRESEGVAAGIAVHGRMVIAHLIMNDWDVNLLSDPNTDFESLIPEISEQAREKAKQLGSVFPEGSYPGNIFKNTSRVRELLVALSG